jgi:hypothetical protein
MRAIQKLMSLSCNVHGVMAVLPKRLNKNLGTLPLFTVQPTFSRGTSGFNCRFLEPVTGKFLTEALVPFAMQ